MTATTTPGDDASAAVPIRDLKRRYKLNLAEGRALPPFDQTIPLPLSTGNPLYDACLTEKLAASTTMSEAEHLNRVWNLVRGATRPEMSALRGAARGLLNDAKLLLALKAWQDGDEALTRSFLRALPWHWRLAFPIAVIKPASHLFTGWKRDLRFRLIEDPRFGALHELYRELLAQAPGVALLKYRRVVHEATALLHYRFEGERERGIHDWCYASGDMAALVKEIEPIGAYVRARQGLRLGGPTSFLTTLEGEQIDIPLTSFVGLLGSSGLSLTEKSPHADGLRAYAVRCATPLESLLRLAEWSPWLTKDHVERVSEKVKSGILETGLDIPFFKVTKAFLAAPRKVKRLALEPLYLPLLAHFGAQAAALLPPPGPLTFVQPANHINVTSFVLYAALASAMPTRFVLLRAKGTREVAPIPLERVGAQLADDPHEMEQWLLNEFGGLATQWNYVYDWKAVGKALRGLDPAAPLVLDLPWANDLDALEALLPFERVFNLSNAFGAPGEVCIAHEYYCDFFVGGKQWSYATWGRYSDSAAQKFAEFLDRLKTFQTLAAAADGAEGGAAA